VVVEMSVRSGARSTANHAAALNRHVMCVPGPVTSATSSGCHRLLRDRPDAVLVTDAAEVVEQCGAMGDLADPEPTPAQARDLLGPTVARVLEAVPVTRAAPVASIARVAGIGPSVVRASLAALVEVGLVRETPSGWTVSKAGRAERRERRELEQLRLELG
jgi:DNA processing protein